MDRIMKDDADVELAEPRTDLGTGRLGVYAAMGAVTGVVPLPVLPDTLARRVRGALAQDVAARHGLSLTPEARAALAAPEAKEEIPPGLFQHALKYATRRLTRRFSPLAVLGPVRQAAETFALGHLLHRYFDRMRAQRSVRIDVEEARRVRRCIDAAVLGALRTDLQTGAPQLPAPPEDLRDQITQLVDGLIIAAASLPDWMVRRLEAGFDEAYGRGHGG